MPIRIMHVVDSLGKGGLENGLVNLISGLDAGCFEHVVCTMRGLGPNLDRLPRDRVQVFPLPKNEAAGRVQVRALASAIRQFAPDVVHSRNWAAVEAVAAGWWRRCGVVHSEHGLEADVNAAEPRRRIWFRRLAFEMADRVLSVSYQLRDLHARRTGFPREKITVVHNGVDTRRFAPSVPARRRARQGLGIAPDEFCIGAVGNLLPVKDHMTLLKAIDGFAKAGGRWRLLLAGEGSERPKLEAFVQGHPEWRPRVSFLGSCNDIPDLLNALDVYVLPSLTEGISNSLLEAMATGLPVVVTDAGGNPEVVDPESGFLFPPGDVRQLAEHLTLLRGNPERRLALAERALARVRDQFSMNSMVRKYAGIYESVRRAVRPPMRAVARA